MSDYRASCNRAKAVRAGIVDARPVGGKSRRSTPVTLYAFVSFLRNEDRGRWHKRGAYRDEETARAAAANFARKHGFYLRFKLGADGAEFDPRTTE